MAPTNNPVARAAPAARPEPPTFTTNHHWPEIVVRHTFLEVAHESLFPPRTGLLPRSMSCGDLPDFTTDGSRDACGSFDSWTLGSESTVHACESSTSTDCTFGERDLPSSKDPHSASSTHDEALEPKPLKASPSARRRLRRRRATADRHNKEDGSASQLRNSGREEMQCVWFGACNAEEALQTAHRAADGLTCQKLVDAVHGVAKSAESDSHALLLGRDPRFGSLVERMEAQAAGLNRGRLVSRAVWALGKVGFQGRALPPLLGRLAKAAAAEPGLFQSATSQELSNTLWGLARLGSADSRCRWCAEQLASRVVETSTKRVPDLTPQCLANSLWAIGKLGLWSPSALAFAESCLREMCSQRSLASFSAQGLANTLWACARLPAHAGAVAELCLLVAREVARERLPEFLPQELSMTIWALAKITAKGGLWSASSRAAGSRQPRRQRATPEVEEFVVTATEEALTRIAEFTPQGLSNVCWALATLELTREAVACAFLTATAGRAVLEMAYYPPQAIANLCWALCRLDSAGEEPAVRLFAQEAAREAERRMEAFKWQDLAGIVSAVNRAELRLREVPAIHSFATALVRYAANQPCEKISKIGTQALLNMALSAARLGVEPSILTPLAERIEGSLGGQEALNDIDRRQWCEVKRHCCA